MEHVIKKILGWLVNFFPNDIFFSSKFESTIIRDDEEFTLDIQDSDNPHQNYLTTALLTVAVGSATHLKTPGSTLTVEFTTVTDQGKDVGNYKITVERTE